MNKIDFKFYFFANGMAQSIFRISGAMTPEALMLGEETIPLTAIAETKRVEDRLVVVFENGASLGSVVSSHLQENCFIVLQISGDIARIEKLLNIASSKRHTEAIREQYVKEGKEALFRSMICPGCRATLNLSELDESQYGYCPLCETIFSSEGAVVTHGETFHVCSECGMFDRIQYYTEFYFYFLLVIYGFKSNRRNLCDSCAGSLFWKMLLANVLFIIGIIPSLVVKYRSMTGKNPTFGDLASANAKALKGDFHTSDPLFKIILDQHPEHPGILFNQAMGHFIGNDGEGGWEYLNRCLKGCSNYLPAIRFIQSVQSKKEAETPETQE